MVEIAEGRLGPAPGGEGPVGRGPRPEAGGRAAREEGLHPRPDQLQRRRPGGQDLERLERLRRGGRGRRQGPPVGLPALLQADPADAQLARPVLRRPAGRRRRRGPQRGRPQDPGAAAGRRPVPRASSRSRARPRPCTSSTRCRWSAPTTRPCSSASSAAGLPRAERAARRT